MNDTYIQALVLSFTFDSGVSLAWATKLGVAVRVVVPLFVVVVHPRRWIGLGVL